MNITISLLKKIWFFFCDIIYRVHKNSLHIFEDENLVSKYRSVVGSIALERENAFLWKNFLKFFSIVLFPSLINARHFVFVYGSYLKSQKDRRTKKYSLEVHVDIVNYVLNQKEILQSCETHPVTLLKQNKSTENHVL